MTKESIRDLSAEFSEKDQPLRRDVHQLGELVGNVIEEQGGEALFEIVERARRLAIARREQRDESDLREAVEGLSPTVAMDLVRAFSLYFRVVNLAETAHRLRRRRQYQVGSGDPQPGSLDDACHHLAAEGLSGEAAASLLARMRVEPVFTAHPTESTRRAVLAKERRIAARLIERFDRQMTPQELRVNLARIRSEVTTIWQTEEHPRCRPQVLDEVVHVLFYLKEVIYPVVPVFFEELESAAADTFGQSSGAEVAERAQPLRFCSWVGGDMDGNPNVNAETLEAALEVQRAELLQLYRRDLMRLADRLTQTIPLVAVDDAVGRRIELYSSWFPEIVAAISKRRDSMPYRTLLLLMQARVDATANDTEHGYNDALQLLADLRAIATSLQNHRGEHAGQFALRRTLRRVETFGLHFASIDVRQDGLVHRRVVARALGESNWLEQEAAQRHRRLIQALENATPPAVPDDPESQETIEIFRAIVSCRERFGERAVGPVIISMSQDSDDVLTVLLLARMAGLAKADGSVPLDVTPLFETVPDLKNAPEIMSRLFSDPLYRQHLSRRGDQQIVMVGYSDSNKDGGLLAARAALQRAQSELYATHREAGIAMTIFHGRGGTVSRGGGKTHRAVLATPPGAVGGRLRMTEQGESIHSKYGLRGIALRNLERSFGAVARAEIETARAATHGGAGEPWQPVLAQMATTSRRAYRALVYETPEFIDYFRTATPIDVIERLAIGSRPASRRSGKGIENLRAIPWIFSWTQSRHLLPGWYGLGTAIEEAVELNGTDPLHAMAKQWPFFRVLLEDVEMVLAKADLGIARRYAGLAGTVGEQIFGRIEEEFDRTVRWVLTLQQADELLANDPTLRRSIRLRNPYVDPMSEIQIDLLARWRATDRQDDELLEALFATVRGIAQGLQNTG